MSVYRLFRLKPVICGLLLVLLVSAAQGQNNWELLPPGQPVPQGVKWASATSTGVNTTATAAASVGGKTNFFKFPVPISASSLGGLAGKAIKRGLPIAGWAMLLKDLINGAGWVIDELQQQVMTPGTPQQQLAAGDWCTVISAGTFCASSPQSLGQGLVGKSNGGDYYFAQYNGVQVISATQVALQMTTTTGNGQFFVITPSAHVYQVFNPSWTNVNPSTAAAAVSAYDLGQLLKNYPQVVNGILIDPVTGKPVLFPELVTALNDLQKAIEAANGLDPGPEVELPPGWETNPDTDPKESPWPDFCDWAVTVCEFMDWAKQEAPEEPPPEVPFEELPIEMQEWSSGLGGGSCPAPYTTSVSLTGASQALEFSVQPVCDFAILIRPLLIAMAMILSPMIIGGFRSSKDG